LTAPPLLPDNPTRLAPGTVRAPGF